MLTKPPKLENGDTIGLVSPSSGLSGVFQERLDRSIITFRILESAVR